MIVLNLEEFTASRRKSQDDAIESLMPLATAWIRDIENADKRDALLAATVRLYEQVYAGDGGTKDPKSADFAKGIADTLDKTTPKSNPETLSVLLAVAAINAATVKAAGHDPEPLVLEWVTMHDDLVRETHKQADGQQRLVGEMFDVGGAKMPYPGYPGVAPELWINCRCILAPTPYPAFANSEAPVWDRGARASSRGEVMADTELLAPLQWHGVLAPEGVMSGDGRAFAPDSLTFRNLPLPLTWQKASGDGHSGSVVVGRIDQIERVGNEMRASGVFLQNAEADEFVGMLAEFGRFGVSVDADEAEFEFDETSDSVTFTKARISSASCVAIPAFAEAYVAMGPWENAMDDGDGDVDTNPEPPDCSCDESADNFDPNCDCSEEEMPPAMSGDALVAGRGPGWLTNPEDTKRIHDYWTVPGQAGYEKVQWGVPGDFNRCRVEVGEEIGEDSPEKLRFINQICAQWHHDATGFWPGRAPTEQAIKTPEGKAAPAVNLVASTRIVAPAKWFKDPGLKELTPLHVGDDGRVFGHIAGWSTCHAAFTDVCVAPPPSSSNYAYFLTGEVVTDEGRVPVGHLTVGGGHAAPDLSLVHAIEHYDSTSSVVADVTVGEDEHGIWCAGWVRPGASEEQVYALRAAALSGDWRRVGYNGDMELIAALAVNSPGFPIPRIAAGISDAVQMSLVAAGVVQRGEDPIEALTAAIERRIEERAARRERMKELAKRVNGE